MWSLFHLLISVTVLLTISSLSECIRIRRSGIAGYDDPYGLTNAFSGMDRPRRQDYRTLLRKRMFEDDDSYFNPNAGSSLDIDPLEFARASRYNDDLQGYLPDYAYQPAETSFGVLERYPLPLPYEGLTDRGYGPQKRTAYKPHRVVPSLDELKSIFGEADVPMKRLAVKRQEPAYGSEGGIDADEAVSETTQSRKNKEDLVKEWGKLINAAEQLTKTNVKTETVDETIEKETDTEDIDEDLEDTLNDSKDDDYVNNELDDLQINESKEESESPVQNTMEERQPQSKSKRASSEGESSDYILGLLKEISDLKRRLYAEELLKDLQSRENDYLANALKFATMDQIQEGDQFVMNEYNDIAKATETEELIQQISDGLEEEEDEEDNDNTGFDEFIEPEVKRSEGETYNSDQWLETPVNENVGIGALLEDNNEDDEEEEINGDDFGGSERPIDIPYIDDELEESDDEPEMETAVAEIDNEEDSNENTKGQEYLLAKLISNLSPGTLESVISDLEEQEMAAESGVCAPVLELSQNCAFADAKGIPIDAEARNLCIRHQLCYTCGSALGISPDRCDNGYKGTVISECENDVKCVRAAAFFLHLMTSRYHTFEEYSPQQCRNQCVADFIYGV